MMKISGHKKGDTMTYEMDTASVGGRLSNAGLTRTQYDFYQAAKLSLDKKYHPEDSDFNDQCMGFKQQVKDYIEQDGIKQDRCAIRAQLFLTTLESWVDAEIRNAENFSFSVSVVEGYYE